MKPGLLALDFDGVVCDGVDEMAESAWRTLPSPPPLSDELRARFAALRPAIESGWEMVALMGMLTERPAGDDAQLRDAAQFVTARDAWMQTHGRVAAELGAALDAARAKWMADDVRGWLGRHRFYPGIAAWLGKLIAEEQLVYVISTKARQFIEALLVWETVPLQPEYVIGRAEPKREKWDVLQTLAIQHDVQATDVWFVEDRLATLVEMRRRAPRFGAKLFFAEWGYVFKDRDIADAKKARIPVLTLEKATGSFERWPR